jgi:hypothetical protein
VGAAKRSADQEAALAGESAANRFASQSGGCIFTGSELRFCPVTYDAFAREAFYIRRKATITRSLRGGAIIAARLKYIL